MSATDTSTHSQDQGLLFEAAVSKLEDNLLQSCDDKESQSRICRPNTTIYRLGNMRTKSPRCSFLWCESTEDSISTVYVPFKNS